MNTITLTLEQQINILSHFFAFGAKVWDEHQHAIVTTPIGKFTGEFSPASDLGRIFTVTPAGVDHPVLELRALTARTHVLNDLTQQPSAGTIDIDFVFADQGCVLVREKYNQETASGGCGIYWLPKDQEEGAAKKLLEVTAQMALHAMTISVGDTDKVTGTFKMIDNTANCYNAAGDLLIGVTFDESTINYDFKPTGSKIQFSK